MSKDIDFKPGSPVRITNQYWPKGVTPWVSIVNNTYNQEKFIIDALESFLMQETTFPVEILVHDDASTDRTAEIVKEYELKYPGLVL
jgi:GT2 family glycosyltransferase